MILYKCDSCCMSKCKCFFSPLIFVHVFPVLFFNKNLVICHSFSIIIHFYKAIFEFSWCSISENAYSQVAWQQWILSDLNLQGSEIIFVKFFYIFPHRSCFFLNFLLINYNYYSKNIFVCSFIMNSYINKSTLC